MALAEIEAIVAEIEKEKEQGTLFRPDMIFYSWRRLTRSAEAERKRGRHAATAASQALMAQALGGSADVSGTATPDS